MNEIEETFRNPDLLIQSIKEMQQKKEESLNEIQLKFNQLNQVKDHLMATNHFKPNLSLFNQNATSSFGSIKLNGYCSNTNSFQSEKLISDGLRSGLPTGQPARDSPGRPVRARARRATGQPVGPAGLTKIFIFCKSVNTRRLFL